MNKKKIKKNKKGLAKLDNMSYNKPMLTRKFVNNILRKPHT